jgi:hypothetical protein
MSLNINPNNDVSIFETGTFPQPSKDLESKTKLLDSYKKNIGFALKNRSFFKLASLLLVPFLLVSFLGYYVADYNLGFNKESAKAKLKRGGYSTDNKSIFRLSKDLTSTADFNLLDLQLKAGANKSYLIAGALYNEKPLGTDIVKKYIDKKTNVTELLADIEDQAECKTLVGLAIENKKVEALKSILKNGNQTVKNDCTLATAQKSKNQEVIEYLQKEAGFGINLAQVNDLVLKGDLGVIPLLNSTNTSSQTELAALNVENLASSLDQRELVKAVFKFATQESKDNELVKALDKSKTNNIIALIEAGADYNKEYIEGSGRKITALSYALLEKNDLLLATLINSGRGVSKPAGSDFDNTTFIEWSVQKDMPLTTVALIDKGVDLDFRVKNLPFVSVIAKNGVQTPALAKIIRKDPENNLIKKLNPQDKEKFFALFISALSNSLDTIKTIDTISEQKSENIKDILSLEFNLNSNLKVKSAYDENLGATFEESSLPIWAYPLSKEYLNSVITIGYKKNPLLKSYLDSLANKNLKFEGSSNGISIIGLAVNTNQIELVKKAIESGTSPNSVFSTQTNESIISVAKRNNLTEIFNYLLDKGAKL